MYFFLNFLFSLAMLLLATVLVDGGNRIDEFLSGLSRNATKNVVYLVLDCETSSLENATRIFHAIRTEFDLIIIAIDDEEMKPFVFIRNSRQLNEALNDIVCVISSDGEKWYHYNEVYTVLSRVLPQMHANDSFLLFVNFERENSTLSSAKDIDYIDHHPFLLKGISVNVLLAENAFVPEKYSYLVSRTGGKILTYLENDMQPLKRQQNIPSVVTRPIKSDYKISLMKKILAQNTRTEFTLPTGTFQIIITAHGQFSKMILISPSGTTINMLGKSEQIVRNRSVNFSMMIANSPASWTLAATGEQYNVTLMMLTNKEDKDYDTQSNDDNDDDDVIDQISLPAAAMERSSDQEIDKKLFQVGGPTIFSGQPNMNMRTDVTHIDQMPTVIDVDSQSEFFALPGEEARFLINVKNNKFIPCIYRFHCIHPQHPCFVRPEQINLAPQQSVQVILMVKALGNDGSFQIVSFVAEDIGITWKKFYLYIGRQRSDSSPPEINFQFNGNCDEANTGNTCYKKRWSADIVCRDTGSGLLNFWAEPLGLLYTSEFIVGTRDYVAGRYSASCCSPKVDISAVDLKGNINKITLDVEHQTLNWIEITAIVMACILLFLAIALVVYGILKWRKKRNERSFLSN